MKKTCTILLLGISMCTNAQVSTLWVNNEEFDPDKSLLKNGDTLVFTVCDINPFIYDYKIGSRLISYEHNEVPELFQTYILDPGNQEKIEIVPGKKRDELAPGIKASLNKLNKLEALNRALRLLVETLEPINVETIEQQRNEIVTQLLGIEGCKNTATCRSSIDQYFRNALLEFSAQAVNFKSFLDQLDKGKSYSGNLIDQAIYINSLIEQVEEGSYKAKVDDLIRFFDKINPSSFCHEEKIIIGKGNEFQLNFSQSPKPGTLTDLETLTKKKDSARFLLGGCIKIDFSTGLFVMGLDDHEFSTTSQATVSDTTQRITRKNYDDFEFGIGALVHIYCQRRYFSPALSAGVSLNGNGNPRYLFGASMIFGRRQRVIFSGGAAIGQVQRLAAHQSIGDTVASFDEVQVVDKNETGWFFGLTYNF